MNVLLEMRAMEEVKEWGSCRRGGIVAMDVKVTRNYEFRRVGVQKVNKGSEVRDER